MRPRLPPMIMKYERINFTAAAQSRRPQAPRLTPPPRPPAIHKHNTTPPLLSHHRLQIFFGKLAALYSLTNVCALKFQTVLKYARKAQCTYRHNIIAGIASLIDVAFHIPAVLRQVGAGSRLLHSICAVSGAASIFHSYRTISRSAAKRR